jgi:hypothetical protein
MHLLQSEAIYSLWIHVIKNRTEYTNGVSTQIFETCYPQLWPSHWPRCLRQKILYDKHKFIVTNLTATSRTHIQFIFYVIKDLSYRKCFKIKLHISIISVLCHVAIFTRWVFLLKICKIRWDSCKIRFILDGNRRKRYNECHLRPQY